MSPRRYTERAVDLLAIVTFSGMFACVLMQVFFRYFLDSPLTWSDELARYLFVWCAFLGWVIAARRRSHLAISAVQMRLRPRVRAAFGAFAALAAVGFAGILTYYGVRITLRNADVETPSLFFTMGVVYAIVPAAAIAVTMHALADVVAAARVFLGRPEPRR
jgi:TRAP-type C4-dicarboxylate transport system permease small subunit